MIQRHQTSDATTRLAASNVQVPRRNPLGHQIRSRVVLTVPVRVINGSGEVVDDLAVGRLNRGGLPQFGPFEIQARPSMRFTHPDKFSDLGVGRAWFWGGLVIYSDPVLQIPHELVCIFFSKGRFQPLDNESPQLLQIGVMLHEASL